MTGPQGIGGGGGAGRPPRVPKSGFELDAFQLSYLSPRPNGLDMGVRGPEGFEATIPFERAWIGERERWVAVIPDPALSGLLGSLLSDARFLRELERQTRNEAGMIGLATARIVGTRDALPEDTFAPNALSPEGAERLRRATGRSEPLAPLFSPLRLEIPGVTGFANPRLAEYRALVRELDIHLPAHGSSAEPEEWAIHYEVARPVLDPRFAGRPLVDAGGNDFMRIRLAEAARASHYLVFDRFALFSAPPRSPTLAVHAVNDDALCALATLQPGSVNVMAVGLDIAVIEDARWHEAFADEIVRVQHPEGAALLISSEASQLLASRPEVRRVTDAHLFSTWHAFVRRAPQSRGSATRGPGRTR